MKNYAVMNLENVCNGIKQTSGELPLNEFSPSVVMNPTTLIEEEVTPTLVSYLIEVPFYSEVYIGKTAEAINNSVLNYYESIIQKNADAEEERAALVVAEPILPILEETVIDEPAITEE